MIDLHPDARALNAEIAAIAPTQRTVSAARERVALLVRRITAGPPVARVTSLTIDGPHGPLAIRHYQPAHETVAAMLYLHGGGWVTGDLETTDALCRVLAAASAWDILSLDYSLAPEARFPQAIEEAYAALRWAHVRFGRSVLLAVGGDSAGANIAAVLTRRARDDGAPELALQLLIYPVTDATMRSESYRQHADGPGSLTSASMSWYFDQYLPPGVDRRHPDVSPLHAGDLHDLPPAHVIVAEFDPLRDDGLGYASALRAAGNKVTVDHHLDMGHGFCMLIGVLDAAEVAARRAAEAMRERLSETARGGA